MSADDLIVDRNSQIEPVLSVVLPTLNEEEGIRECLEGVRSAVEELEVTTEILVSDSSTDRTPQIARKMGAIVLEPDDLGYGYAYRYAFRRARGAYIVMGDADCTYDFTELPPLFDRLVTADADIMMGDRLSGEIRPGAMPALHRYVGNPLLTRFLNLFYDAGVNDAHSGFRIVTREALETLDLESEGMEFASEMVMEAAVRGLEIVEVPITYHERRGEATLDSFHDGWRHVRFMLVNAPTYLFTVPAVGFFGAGAVVLMTSLLGVQFVGITFGTHTSIAGSLLTIIGVHVAGLAVYSALAANPIKTPRDPLVSWTLAHFSLEQGIMTGVVLAASGVAYVLVVGARWVTSGFTQLPLVEWDIVAFTTLVIGVQLVFQSFFLNMLD